ncbi:hypothetical protein ALC53_05961 [Atta colombica]|uniref:Uncharacterized protein n=1 Tax=Atta colombica TaxID=520822 RepID=A0A195BHB6_9HYME|nr:hypothetical protein ALC53_05961 [Atta colombica]
MAMRSREGNDRRRLSVVDDSRDFMIRYIEGESEEEGGEPRNAPREGTVTPRPASFQTRHGTAAERDATYTCARLTISIRQATVAVIAEMHPIFLSWRLHHVDNY